MSQPNSAEEHKLISSFEAIRKTLMQQEYADRWDKPLAYWALPNDRRLPLAFLGKSVGELLQTPFQELSATRGIGQKKISSLVKLLHRATHNEPPAVPYGIKELAEELEQQRNGSGAVHPDSEFDPALVSEVLWVQWSDTVRRFHLEAESLGRLAPSLQALPTVIWDTQLGEYVHHSLTEIRDLRTHGEKRVRVILEVFASIHELLAAASQANHLSVRLVPAFVLPIEQWLKQIPARRDCPSIGEVVQRLVEPLLQQIQIDSGPIVYRLSRDRLGVTGEPKSVRAQAEELEVTRARVYQLLEDCDKVMGIRWPEGRHLLHASVNACRTAFGKTDATDMMVAAAQLFFPTKRIEVELE